MSTAIGYFAHVERPDRRSLVHIVVDGKPVCGARTTGQFQFCAAFSPRHRYIECKHCKKGRGL